MATEATKSECPVKVRRHFQGDFDDGDCDVEGGDAGFDSVFLCFRKSFLAVWKSESALLLYPSLEQASPRFS
jgi:hypothetical protein